MQAVCLVMVVMFLRAQPFASVRMMKKKAVKQSHRSTAPTFQPKTPVQEMKSNQAVFTAPNHVAPVVSQLSELELNSIAISVLHVYMWSLNEFAIWLQSRHPISLLKPLNSLDLDSYLVTYSDVLHRGDYPP